MLQAPIVVLAQAAESSTRPFFERLTLNDTIRNTTLPGWMTLLAGIFAGVVLGKITYTVLRAVGASLQKRGWLLRAILCSSLSGPANLAIISLGVLIGVGRLAPSDQLHVVVRKGTAIFTTVTIGWLLYNLVDLVDSVLGRLAAGTQTKLDDQLVPLVRKTLRIFVVVVVSLFAAQNIFGADIGAWLAGLGIVGLAVSLAAQDSIKNVFGSLTILFDHPFQQGDTISLDGQMGTVEEVGFRSTRIRTPQGSVLTVPNSKISDNTVENLSRRRYIRRVMNVTVPYDTPLAKVEMAVEIVREVLRSPEVAGSFDLEGQPPRVYFDELNADSLNIKVFYWFASMDYWAYLEHCQKVNVRLMRRFEEAGIEFALPTRTLYLAGDSRRQLRVLHDVAAKEPAEAEPKAP